MQLEIKIDGQSYIVQHEVYAEKKDLVEAAHRFVKGEFTILEFPTIGGDTVVLGQEALKRAVYVSKD